MVRFPAGLRRGALWAALLALSLVAAACGSGGASSGASEPGDPVPVEEMPALEPVELGGGERLRVAATTSIVADVVSRVGGDAIELTRLVPLGTDPHTYQLTPQDVAAVAGAHVLVTNGLGLEEFLPDLLDATDGAVPVVPASHGVALLSSGEGEDAADDGHGDEGADPHTWFDPRNVVVWTRNIEAALSALDAANAETYAANAAAYIDELNELDAWIREQVATIPEERRLLVTDHTLFTYFAAAYGFRQVGAIIPGYSTLAEPSAQEMAALQRALGELDVPAVFVSTTVNPRLAEQLAEDTGTRLVYVYTGSLSEAGGPADSYLDFMRHNVSVIVEALR